MFSALLHLGYRQRSSIGRCDLTKAVAPPRITMSYLTSCGTHRLHQILRGGGEKPLNCPMVGDTAKRHGRFGQRRLRAKVLILLLQARTQFGSRAEKAGL